MSVEYSEDSLTCVRDDSGTLTAIGYQWDQPVPRWHRAFENVVRPVSGGLTGVMIAAVIVTAAGHGVGPAAALVIPFGGVLVLLVFLIRALYERLSETMVLLFTVDGKITIRLPRSFFGRSEGQGWATHKRGLEDLGSIELQPMMNMGGRAFRFESVYGPYFAYDVIMYFRTGETDQIATHLRQDQAREVAARLNLAVQQIRPIVADRRAYRGGGAAPRAA